MDMPNPVRLSIALIVMVACLSVISGCATMSYPSAYKVEGKEVKDFKGLSDEQALKIVALIYNTSRETWEDRMARDIALNEYVTLLKKRHSAYINKSGIFNMQYDKTNLSSWKRDDLIKLYDALGSAANSYYMDSAHDLTEIENAKRIAYLTAINSIEKELKKRDSSKNVAAIAVNALGAAILFALSMV